MIATAIRKSHIAVMAAALCFGCASPPGDPVSIRFEAHANGDGYSCAPQSSKTGDGSVISTLAFFIHDVRLVDTNGARHAVVLDGDGVWQTEGVALLDFEDGSGVCRNGTPGTRREVTGVVSSYPQSVAGIEFSLGVPFSLNHGDPAKAVGPLAGTRMHWSWRGGYKFLRLDGRAADGAGFRVHVGSTGCEGRITDIVSCKRPNVAQVSISPFDPRSQAVVVDLDRLFDGGQGAAELLAHGCMAEADEPGCAAVFSVLGLGSASGLPESRASLFVAGAKAGR
jgi:uncharacterized repeat protein (TIGR04052 family)